MTWQPPGGQRETTIRGVTYPSRAEAARSIGVTPETVRQAASTGNLDAVGSRTVFETGRTRGRRSSAASEG